MKTGIKIGVFGLLFILISGIQSCREYNFEADLQVNIRGLLSGSPREGIPIQVFESEFDAQELRFPVTPVIYTDYFGEVTIFGLEPGREYWIRADALLSTKIRSTGRLRSGSNQCTIRFL